MSAALYLYLDFDGVLHPHDVVLDAAGMPYVRSPRGASLFENAQLMEQLLAPYQHVRIILSTSWVAALGHDKTVAHLSNALAGRVIGSTYIPMSSAWGDQSFAAARGREVMADVRRRELAQGQWLAVDDSSEGWAELEAMDHLVLVTDGVQGIRHPDTQLELERKLELHFGQRNLPKSGMDVFKGVE